MFFKAKPNLPDGEKARLEFHLQQIADALGMERMRLPVLGLKSIRGWMTTKTPQQIIATIGEHLSHDVGDVGFNLDPKQLQQCGGGG